MTTTTMAPETAPTLTMAPKSLADALAAVKAATGTRSAVAALSGVHIFTRDGAAFIETTDMETFARKRLDADVLGDIDALVSHADAAKAAKLFAKRAGVRIEPSPRVVRTFTDEHVLRAEMGALGHDLNVLSGYNVRRGAARDVLVYLADVERVMAREPETVDDVRVTDGARTIVLQSLRMEDFPAFPAGDETALLYTDHAHELGAALERAANFASSDETRPILTGIAFNYRGETLRLQATDSYRLCDLAAPASSWRERDEQDGIVNVPARGLLMAAKLMRKSTEPVSVSTVVAKVGGLSRGTYALVRHAGLDFAIRTCDGQYPDFARLVPDSHEVELTAPVAELAGACEVAVAFARKNAPMRLVLNGSVKVTGSTPDIAEFEEVLANARYTRSEAHRTVIESNGAGAAPSIAQPEPDEFAVGFNAEFFASIVKVYGSATATLRLISPLRPGLFVDGDDRYLLMPIRLNV